MAEKVFVDSDVILDLLAMRQPFYNDAATIFTSAYRKKIVACTTAVVLANVAYILRKIKGNEEAKKQLKNLRLIIRVLPIDEKIVDKALKSVFKDFEDGLQYFAARENGINTIITRNIKDYKVRDVVVLTPEAYVNKN